MHNHTLAYFINPNSGVVTTEHMTDISDVVSWNQAAIRRDGAQFDVLVGHKTGNMLEHFDYHRELIEDYYRFLRHNSVACRALALQRGSLRLRREDFLRTHTATGEEVTA